KEGTKAPAFRTLDQDGNPVSLSDFKGKKVVLYFYPEDDTPGCTAQACNLRDHYTGLKKKGFEVLGVSMNTGASHKKFEKKFDLPFRLLADTDGKMVHAYGVYGEKQLFGRKFMGIHRTTFLIDEKGIIRKIILKPDTAHHTEEVLQAWEEISRNGGQ
ncbi:MAG TPA: thioredoxin-dependent thiol peroxidase, partial [Chitinophagaceae bacterium]|nr:thioredoxin-dependent thiol peroxidase [Chitinophagaceae bacterium]